MSAPRKRTSTKRKQSPKPKARKKPAPKPRSKAPAKRESTPQAARKPLWRRVLRWASVLTFVFLLGTSSWVFLYRYVNPPVTALMLLRHYGEAVSYTHLTLPTN